MKRLDYCRQVAGFGCVQESTAALEHNTSDEGRCCVAAIEAELLHTVQEALQ